MSPERTAASAARSVGSGATRVVRAWGVLPHERRLAAGAAFGLFLTLFLPWYQETAIVTSKTKLQSATVSVTGWGAFSFVEAAVLLVAVAVLTLLIQRAEGRAFHLPGGDGWVIMLAGFWTCALVIWRIFDKQGTNSHQLYATTSGIEWGIFVALAVAAFLTYTGSRIRSAHTPEPPLPGDAGRRTGAVIARPAAGPEPAEDPAPAPAPPRAPAPAPAPPSQPGAASDRRTGWLTAPREGWIEDPDTARREPAGGWSYADDYPDEPAADYEEEPPIRRGPPADYDEDPPTRPAPRAEPRQRRSADASRPEDPTNVQSSDDPASNPPRGRRRRRQPDDQLTIKLDRDNNDA